MKRGRIKWTNRHFLDTEGPIHLRGAPWQNQECITVHLLTDSELRDELKAAFEAAAVWGKVINSWDAPTFEAWHDQHMRERG